MPRASSHREVISGMGETHQGVPEEFIFGIVLPEEESAVAAHGGLDLNHQLMVFQATLCNEKQTGPNLLFKYLY